MRLDDSARPRLGEMPQYLGPDGTPVAVVPEWVVSPPGGFRVAVMLVLEDGGARWFEVEDLSKEQLILLRLAWEDNPEECMRINFGWSYAKVTSPPAGSLVAKASLGDLDL